MKYDDSPIGDDLVSLTERWFREHVGCIAGQREFNLGRYVYGSVRRELDALDLLAEFKTKTESFLAAGCLMIFPEADGSTDGLCAVKHTLLKVGEIVSSVLGLPMPSIDGAGKSLTATLPLRCPVTNQTVEFDDFDAIAFLPQAGNPHSPLYDPNIEAPFVCVNLTSDLYGFSLFTRDRARILHQCEVWEIDNLLLRESVFTDSAERWQQMALKTIEKFANRTQAERLRPIHASPDQRHWFAMHEDAAFGEIEKSLHKHEMPVIYTDRIIAKWRDFYTTGLSPDIRCLAPKGMRC